MKRFYFVRGLTVALCLLLVAMGGHVQESKANYAPKSGQRGKDVIWSPTPQERVDTMLNMANVTSADYVIDLGSGDGRIVIAAAKRGATALGIEYNPDLVEFARRAAIEEGVAERAAFEKADIFESDFSQATVVTMYLLPHINLRLRPKILDLKPGTRIVSNSFNMADWKPDKTTARAHLWIVPAKVDGVWKLDDGQVSFTQKFQHIDGTLTAMGKDMELSGKLDGDKISFTAGSRKYTGTVSGNTISGTHDGGGSWKATR